MAYYAALTSFPYQSQKRFCFSRIRASSSSSAATGRFDLKTLESAIAKVLILLSFFHLFLKFFLIFVNQ